MKNSEKKLLLLATISIGIIFSIAILVLLLVNSLEILLYLKTTLFVLIFLVFIFCIYLSVNYFLSPMFKTNYLLELLLKDTLHELNIPLSVIKANLQLLRFDETSSKKIKRLDRVNLACVDLDRLYHDMDYYIKREVLYDLREEFDVEEMIENEIEKVKALNLNVNIKVNLQPLYVKADKHGFVKILSNIMDNAIKYSKDEKNIEISLNNAKLSIIDNGIGMDESEIFKVFDRYYQSDNEKKGSGIGLSIVKAYCDEEKIFINILSKKDTGTEFILDLKNILV